MIPDEIKEKIITVLKQQTVPLVLGALGVSFLGYGLIQSLVIQRDSSEITFSPGQQQEVSVTKTVSKDKEIVVDVEGAVLKPGIHKLPQDSRVQDALLAASGMTEKADHQKISAGMNLAAKVVDGAKVYIPFDGETAAVSVGQVAGISNGTTGEATGLININTAGESQLDTLPGIGPATAQKIIANRPYASVDELLSKKSVGKSVFEKIKEKVTAN